MQKLFLFVGVLFFVGGGYYMKQNYTFVHIDTSQVAQVGSSTLQSSAFSGDSLEADTDDSRVIFRVGSFALIRR